MTTFVRVAASEASALVASGGWVGGGCGVTLSNGACCHVVSVSRGEAPGMIILRMADGYSIEVPGDVELELVN